MIEAEQVVSAQVELPPGYSSAWSGQWEHMVRAEERLTTVVHHDSHLVLLL